MAQVKTCRHVWADTDNVAYRCARAPREGSEYCGWHSYRHTPGRVAVSDQLELQIDTRTEGYPPF